MGVQLSTDVTQHSTSWLPPHILYEIQIDRAISCPGHGKDIVDGVNGIRKTEVACALANQMKTAAKVDDDSASDTKKFADGSDGREQRFFSCS